MNYAVLQRIRMIDFLFKHYGYVQREALMDYFGISSPCSSRDISDYNAIAPDNAVYNPSTRRWEASASFVPIYE